jgi:microcystin degradation protein MlrC
MKIFSAFLATETNTYAAAPTGWGSFLEYGIFHGDASTRDPEGLGGSMVELRRLLAAGQHELVESVTAFAQPLGRTVRAVYERLRDDILGDLRDAISAGPVDGVILLLHGAMAADGHDDCEGDLIARVRELVGPDVPIGVELDLHCHCTALMQRGADVIIAYKEYPHVDALARLEELVRIVLGTAGGRLRPTTAMFDCKMVGLWHTTREPMAGFVRRMQEIERAPGVLSVSLGHGFPWGDVPESGARLWVVTDDDPGLAAALAEQLGREFWALRHATVTPMLTIAEALDRVDATDPASPGNDRPMVIADVADNAGGGAMSDSTFILQALIASGTRDVAIGAFWDLGAIRICRDAGVGARIALRIGGKCGPASGDPVDVEVVVKGIVDGLFQLGLNSNDERAPLGPSVWVQAAGGLDIVLVSVRTQTFSPIVFSGLGIALAAKRLIVVKSTQHFHAQFAPLAREILYVTTPGAISMDFAALPYRVRDLDYWPRVADPHRFEPMQHEGARA